MNKKLFSIAVFAFIFATQPIFSQGFATPSSWPPDSVNVSQAVIKPFIDQLFQAAIVLGQDINSASTVGPKITRVYGSDTIWDKTITTDVGLVFEAGASIHHFEPYWFSIEVDDVKIQWVPGNQFGQVWTNWGPNGNQPNWGFVLNGYEMVWEPEENGEGQFTQADLTRVQNAIATIARCVPPYQDFSIKPMRLFRIVCSDQMGRKSYGSWMSDSLAVVDLVSFANEETPSAICLLEDTIVNLSGIELTHAMVRDAIARADAIPDPDPIYVEILGYVGEDAPYFICAVPEISSEEKIYWEVKKNPEADEIRIRFVWDSNRKTTDYYLSLDGFIEVETHWTSNTFDVIESRKITGEIWPLELAIKKFKE